MKQLYFHIIFFSTFFLAQAQIEQGELATGVTKITRLETFRSTPDPVQTEKASMGEVTALIGGSSEVGSTQGELSVSLSGAANYTIPIAMPPGINGVVPQVSLAYNSQGGNGMAGYGWNISGISSISRIPATKYHDGVIDPVNFNDMDRFALDGQRLIAKSGTYGGNGTIYETENFSNVKITSYGTHSSGANYGPAYFLVEYPDGSKAYYGYSANSSSITDWSITYWENPQGVRINYSYNQTNNTLNISSIGYGTIEAATPINEIQFLYKTRQRAEQFYVGGQSIVQNLLLDQIKVFGNGVGFRNYFLGYNAADTGYERLTSITEKSGDLSKSYNPTVFSYEDTPKSIQGSAVTTSLSVGNITSSNSATVSGDFDGDGGMDFIIYPTTGPDTKSKYWIFSDIGSSSNTNIGREHAVGNFDEIFPVNWVNFNNILMPMQGWTVVKGNTFTTYAQSSYGIIKQDQKIGNLPTSFAYYSQISVSQRSIPLEGEGGEGGGSNPICDGSKPPKQFTKGISRKYYSGDFNGDGITDIIAIENNETYSYVPAPCDINGNPIYITRDRPGEAHFVNLDPRLTSNFVTNLGTFSKSDNSKILIADFNGDGKSDIYVFDTGKVRVYSLSNNNGLVSLAQIDDANIVLDKPILLGDYNGDGKTDFIIPKESGSSEWYKYSSTGVGIVKETQSYFNFPTNTSEYSYEVIPTDYNNDGKTDLLLTSASRGSGWSVGSLNIRCYVNKNGTFSESYSTSINNQPDINTDAKPIFLSSNQPNKKLGLAFINNNKIFFFISDKDFSKEHLLKIVTEGNGISEKISYESLGENYGPGYGETYINSGYTEIYPNIDIINAPTFRVVTKLEKTSATVSTKQLFSYYGAVSNVEGLGFLGFRGISKTNWFNDSTNPISNVSSFNPSLRGANTENYTVAGYYTPSSTPPSSFITKSVLTYNTDVLQSNKVFKLKALQAKQFNSLEGTSTETTTEYDDYNSPTTSTTLIKEGSDTIQTTNTTLAYNAPTTSPYTVGMPTSKTQSVVTLDDTMTSEENYTYNNCLLSKIKKKGANTDFLTEENTYDAYGNITQKTISASGVAPRTTKYTYDTSGRFLTQSKDIEGLATSFVYDKNNGTLLSETNPYNLTTTYKYDSWFRKIKTTDYLGKSNTYTYSKNAGKTIITTTGDDGSATEQTYDDLGRKEKEGVKNINGVLSYVSCKYDIYDRKTQTSEPYFGTSASQWNITKYDNYSRITQNTSVTGQITNISYAGLTTTVSDDTKTKTTTKNAIGNAVSVTDAPGGNIQYKYFANGNLKESDYQDVKTTIEQDGWGRKTKLTDASAGIYSYEYNELGETTKETTPNGTTTYTLDDVGKIIEKTIVGTNTNSKTTYTYDSATKLLINSKFEDLANGGSVITNTYTYDNYKRIIQTVETTPFAKFTKELTYDDFGRIATEKSIVTVASKTSGKTIKNVYKNGFLWQILDNETSVVLWQTNNVNARGQLISAQNGPITITKTYDNYGFPTRYKYDKTANAVNIITLNTVFEAKRGNLTSRNNSLFGTNETFKYDNLDRLTEFTNTKGEQETQTYDDLGRITENNLGTYNYEINAKPYQNSSIELVPEASEYYSNRENATGKYYLNGDMEAKTGWGAMRVPDEISYSYSTEVAHSGQTSLKIENPSTDKQYLYADKWIKIKNKKDTKYTFSAWVYTDNPKAEIKLFMRKGSFVTAEKISSDTASKYKWELLTKTVVVPANIDELTICLYNYGGGNVWFDEVVLAKTVDPTEAVGVNISYNTFKSPVEIEEAGVDRISFVYNDQNSRTAMFYGSDDDDKLQRPNRKYYSADGTMEVKQNTATGAVEFITYIGGDAYSAPIVLKSDGVKQNYLYLQRDYQGSILSITDENGAVLEKRQFDAWGAIVKVQDGAGNTLNVLTIIDRGYTGHEHLQSVGLINMNARLYDPVLHRFLQPDNYVQNPYDTQNYNRYSYVLNNPLKYTDPSGESFWNSLVKAFKPIVKIITSAVVITASVVVIAGAIGVGTIVGIGQALGTGFQNTSILTNEFKIIGGLFQGNTQQIVSRFTKELPQTLAGLGVTLLGNSIGAVRSVSYYGGATVAEYYGGNWGAFTLGSYINGNKGIYADPNNSLFQHEYGHYLQSQDVGWDYIYDYAIPSAIDSATSGGNDKNGYNKHDAFWTEQDANIRGENYFGSKGWNYNRHPIYGSGKNDNFDIDYGYIVKKRRVFTLGRR